jgi:hypothetical protein
MRIVCYAIRHCNLTTCAPCNILGRITQSDAAASENDLFNYYVTCTGTSPVTEILQDSQDQANLFSMQCKGLSASCEAEQMSKVYSPLDGLAQQTGKTLRGLDRELSCTSITPILTTMTHDVMCGSFISGMFSLWKSQIVAFVFLFWAMIYAAFVREHFQSSICPCICGGDLHIPEKQGTHSTPDTDGV